MTPSGGHRTPGSVRRSVLLLTGVALAGVALLAVTDGVGAAALGVAVFTAGGIAVARYAAGGSARDGGYRRAVRLVDSSEPVLGGWEWMVHNALGADGGAYFTDRLRPQLQRLFAARLAAEHFTDLYRAPERARVLIGSDLWPWIDPEQPPPRSAVPEPVLRALLDRLESLAQAAPQSDARSHAGSNPQAPPVG